ncbi:integrase (fragment) [Staphylococcus argenteus]
MMAILKKTLTYDVSTKGTEKAIDENFKYLTIKEYLNLLEYFKKEMKKVKFSVSIGYYWCKI